MTEKIRAFIITGPAGQTAVVPDAGPVARGSAEHLKVLAHYTAQGCDVTAVFEGQERSPVAAPDQKALGEKVVQVVGRAARSAATRGTLRVPDR